MMPIEIEALETPPEFGSLEFTVDMAPASHQGKSPRKKLIREAIAAATRETKWLLSGEVQINIEWLLHERLRYETASSPDVDNILKPLLDALRGPSGIMIDDCQVQSVQCNWIDWNSQLQRVRYDIRFMPGEFVRKRGLVFVGIGGSLYMPLHTDEPIELKLRVLDLWESMMHGRDKLVELTGDYHAGQHVMPIQHPFHISHIRDFPRITTKELRKQLEGTLSQR